MSKVFISICIPAYKRVEYLNRLLESISLQHFKDFEVIVTDDSPIEDVAILCEQYKTKFTLFYHKNKSALGTPENWNEAIRKANGQWIKIMHDDDWFVNSNSLGVFASIAKENKNKFIFSSYINVYFPNERKELIKASRFRLIQLVRNPVSLLSKNIIGPPSVTMYRNTGISLYDKSLKWLVDIDYYTQRLKDEEIFFINKALIYVGISNEQVTFTCHTNPEVEIPENYYFLQKYGSAQLKNILVYDAWWRLLRNFKIMSKEQLQKYNQSEWPDIILKILKDVNRMPSGLLKIGLLSKLVMTFSYFKNRLFNKKAWFQ